MGDNVAAIIKLSLRGSHYLNRNEPIIEVPAGSHRRAVSQFIAAILPGKPIEHLAVKEMAFDSCPNRYFNEKVSPSSLFFQALHGAYAKHHAFGIRPEVLMYLINSVIAETVKQNPREYQALFTSSDKKTIIKVRHDGLRRGDPASPWGEAIPLFESELRGRVPSKIMDQMLPRFSTSTPESDVASLIAFMDSASPYYNYHVCTLCGIPRIVLFGQPSDYALLLDQAKALSVQFVDHLKPYFDNLIPVLEEIERASRGIIDDQFWSEIYKHNDGSGTPSYGGWISSFIWYVNEIDSKSQTSRLVAKHVRLHDWRNIDDYGVSSKSEPSHVNSVPFVWEYIGNVLKMAFIGGVLSIDVCEDAITPRLSYGILDLN